MSKVDLNNDDSGGLLPHAPEKKPDGKEVSSKNSYQKKESPLVKFIPQLCILVATFACVLLTNSYIQFDSMHTAYFFSFWVGLVLFLGLLLYSIKRKIGLKYFIAGFTLTVFYSLFFNGAMLFLIYLMLARKNLGSSYFPEVITPETVWLFTILTLTAIFFAPVNVLLLAVKDFKRKLLMFLLRTVILLVVIRLASYPLLFLLALGGSSLGLAFISYLMVVGLYLPIAYTFLYIVVPFLIASYVVRNNRLLPATAFSFLLLMVFFVFLGVLSFPFKNFIIADAEHSIEKALDKKEFLDNPVLMPSYLPPKVTLDFAHNTPASYGLYYKCGFAGDSWRQQFNMNQSTKPAKSDSLTGWATIPSSGKKEHFIRKTITINGELGVVVARSDKPRSYSMRWLHGGRLFALTGIYDSCFYDKSKADALSYREKDDYILPQIMKMAESAR